MVYRAPSKFLGSTYVDIPHCVIKHEYLLETFINQKSQCKFGEEQWSTRDDRWRAKNHSARNGGARDRRKDCGTREMDGGTRKRGDTAREKKSGSRKRDGHRWETLRQGHTDSLAFGSFVTL